MEKLFVMLVALFTFIIGVGLCFFGLWQQATCFFLMAIYLKVGESANN